MMRTLFARIAWPVSLIALLFLTVHGRSQLPHEARPKSQITVGPNVQVSKAREKVAHAEVVIAADPSHEGRLLVGSMVQQGSFQTVAYTSLDGGKTWSLALEKSGSGDDPAVAYGPDGTAYFASLPVDASRVGFNLEVTASRDEGHSWSAPLVARPRVGAGIDRPFLAVDCTQGKFHGNLYCCCLNGDLVMYRSRDGGKTFAAPKILMCKYAPHYSVGRAWGQGVVLSNGALVFPYIVSTRASIGRLSLRVRRSTTGGESFQEEQILHDYLVERKVFDSTRGFPKMAADPASKAFKDRLYLVWAEVRGAGTCVMLSLSKDQGVTWSPPAVISDFSDVGKEAGSSSRYTLLPTVAVNRSGIVAVSWYDTSFVSPEKFCCDLRFRASVDGGATWLPSVGVTEVSSTYDKGSPGSQSRWLGDTAGLTADSAGAFHPLWIDNRTGVKQVFTASVLVQPDRLGGGASKLSPPPIP